MKILHITKKYDNLIGGDTVVVRNLRKQQLKNNDKVFILTSNNSTIINNSFIYKYGLKIKDEELDVINIKRILSLFILFFYSFKLLKEIKPDVIHSHSIDMGFACSIASRYYKIPQITTFHNGFFSNKNTNLVRGLLERIFIAVSGFNKIITVNIDDTQAVNNNKVYYFANGVDTNIFKPLSKKSNKDITILYVGRLVKIKGLDYLLSAVNSINSKQFQSKLQIIGEGDYKVELVNKIKNLKNSNVQFVNKTSQTQLAKYYSKADVVVLPSINQEGFGLVLIEALASGTPVITTNVSGLSSYIKKYNCGLVVPQKNSAKLADAILKIALNKVISKKFVKNGTRLIRDKFSWEKIASQTQQVYLNALYE